MLHFRIACDQFAQALARVQDFLTKTTPEYLVNVLIKSTNDGSLSLSATDLDMSIQTQVKTEMLVQAGEVLLDGKKLFSLIKAIPSELLEIQVDASFDTKITYGTHQEAHLQGLNPQDFPKIDQIDTNLAMVEVKPSIFKDLFKRTSFATGVEESRIRLTGVYLVSLEDGVFQAVATDGYRLCLVKRKIAEKTPPTEMSALIPKKGVTSIAKLMDSYDVVEIASTKSNFILKTPDFLVSVRLINEDFPDYKAIIPKSNQIEFVYPIASLKSAMKRAISIVDELNNAPVNLKMSGNKLHFEYKTSTSSRSILEEIEINNPGDKEYSITFSLKYLNDILNIIEGSQIKALYGAQLNPVILVDSNHEDDTFILMARRSNS